MKIGTVVEGPTDRLLLKAIIEKVYPGEHDFRDLQPADVGNSFGQRGTGWKGVRRYCFDIEQQLNTNIIEFIREHQFDLLIIHIDADVVTASDLQEQIGTPIEDISLPCPPILSTTDNIREIIAKWLNLDGVDQFPSQVVLAIPAQDSENWVFAALFSKDGLCQNDDYECIHPLNDRQHPAYLLTLSQYGRVLRRKSGKIRKSKRNYQQVLSDVTNAWDDVCKICSQAQLFNDGLVTFQEVFETEYAHLYKQP